jgi:AraC-like DNA-binding protein
MKPAFEKVSIDQVASLAVLDRRLDQGIPFEWHHHPEFELTLTMNSRGHRIIGDHAGGYDDGDLVLVGPNVPHSWCSQSVIDPGRPHSAIVVWFSEKWINDLMALAPELGCLRELLLESRRGVQFSEGAARDARASVESLPGASAEMRLLTLLQVLRKLAADSQRMALAAPSATPASLAPDPRLQRVLDHLHLKFDEPVEIEGLARIASMSPSALHRLFRRHTRMTPIAYVTRLRIGAACSLLIENDQSIAMIAARVGYNNVANFNRQFRGTKKVTPREFRELHRLGRSRRRT